MQPHLTGPFDLAAIPIGAYTPRWFMSPIHCSPHDAACLHKDVQSKHSIAMVIFYFMGLLCLALGNFCPFG